MTSPKTTDALTGRIRQSVKFTFAVFLPPSN